jgi:hypothetical protein
MNHILHIISSPKGQESVTIRLGNAIVDKLQIKHPDSIVTTMNLITDPFPHINAQHLEAFHTPAALRTAAQTAMAKSKPLPSGGLPKNDWNLRTTSWQNNAGNLSTSTTNQGLKTCLISPMLLKNISVTPPHKSPKSD